MLYVIWTEAGKEAAAAKEMKAVLDKGLCSEIFILRYENVLRREGVYQIERRNLFPSYVFVETDNPAELFLELRRVVNLTVLRSDKNEEGYTFLPVSESEEEFLRKLINGNENYIVTLSLVSYDARKRINRAAGPLKYFMDKITQVDNRHRRAFVEMVFLGKPRRLVFGICTKGDGLVPDGAQKLKDEFASYSNAGLKGTVAYVPSGTEEVTIKDYNLNTIEVDDKVIIRDELYGSAAVRVVKVNGKKNTVTVEVPLFGWMQKIEMDGMDVEKV